MEVTKIHQAGCGSYDVHVTNRSKTCLHFSTTNLSSIEHIVTFHAGASYWSGTRIVTHNTWGYRWGLATKALHFNFKVSCFSLTHHVWISNFLVLEHELLVFTFLSSFCEFNLLIRRYTKFCSQPAFSP